MKIRTASCLDPLTIADRERVITCHEEHGHAAAIELLQREYGIECSFRALIGLSAWVRAHRATRQAQESVDGILEAVKSEAPGLTEQQLFAIGHNFFQHKTLEAANAREWVAVQKARIDRERLELDKRKLALLEKKAALADEAQQVAASNLTPEQKAERFKAIFGLA